MKTELVVLKWMFLRILYELSTCLKNLSAATRRHKCTLIWMKFGRDLLLQPTGARAAPDILPTLAWNPDGPPDLDDLG